MRYDARNARIAALEAELAEAKALYQTSVTAFGEMHKRLTANRAAAVQAERERASYWSDRANISPSERHLRIKNGDPAP